MAGPIDRAGTAMAQVDDSGRPERAVRVSS